MDQPATPIDGLPEELQSCACDGKTCRHRGYYCHSTCRHLGYTCILPIEHDGPHVACGSTHNLCIWTDDKVLWH